MACGVSTCWTTPSFITAILSPTVSASSWSWVTKIMVVASLRWISLISVRISTRSAASSAASGSSSRNASGSITIARPSAARCPWPPDSSRG